ncbi:MAG: ketoacyl-ACP synthase III [Alphaproteobacteria bacterium]|nr:ketoacyl-ACP synthase III [Alphaproteobacteria bacterium]
MRITSTGLYLPPRIETAEDLAPRLGRSAAWIRSRTGVAARRVSDLQVEEMAAAAARDALGDGPPPDLLINASTVPRQLVPDTSVFVLRELGLSGVPAFSVRATCLSFLVALNTAAALIAAGPWRRVLVVSSDRGTVGRDFDDPKSAALFGDGAAAAVLVPARPSRLLAFEMGTWPEGAALTEIRGGGVFRHPQDPRTTPQDNLFAMDGPGIYKLARRKVEDVLDRLFERAGVPREAVDRVIPHQASGLAVKAIRRYGFPEDRVVDLVAEHGNCVSASIPMTLATAQRRGWIRPGDLLLLMGTGAGLSVAAALLRWDPGEHPGEEPGVPDEVAPP